MSHTPDFLQTDEVESTKMLPLNAGNFQNETAYRVCWGIDALLFPDSSSHSNFIVQNEEIVEERITDTTQGQKGEVVAQLDYDQHWTMTMNVIGGSDSSGGSTNMPVIGSASEIQAGDIVFMWRDKAWKVQSVRYVGTYNDKKKFTVTCERWTNFPPTPA